LPLVDFFHNISKKSLLFWQRRSKAELKLVYQRSRAVAVCQALGRIDAVALLGNSSIDQPGQRSQQ
jgi:hypothetical protein